ncbi:DUF262 domain-containing protein [Bacillus thuringiensis]|uniref:DUF262 domain-containing protein n=1 Tax=Bacillus thuringiensis TaxID=1428 RepID=UPI0021D65D9C|nr:DUF262 domain-containing protein [Bacillus thuringiensis]MCU7668171.1 DUF262 domain-containing protein [Bacillus thuringiensis]
MKLERRNQTDVERWDVGEVLDSISLGKMKNALIKLPTFQRNLVWTKSQKDLFIDSLKKGYPIGSLLLFEKTSTQSDEPKKYLLVDGLQRTNALNEYSSKPTIFFLQEDISDDLIDTIVSKTEEYTNNRIDKEKLRDYLHNWVRDKEGLEESNHFSGGDLASDIDEDWNLDLEKKHVRELKKKITPFIEEIKKEADINNLKLPILIFRGDVNNLPEIFKRINKQGTQLNKYQIFAAVWEDGKYGDIEIKNKKIRDKIMERYEALTQQEFLVEGYSGNEKEFHTSKFNYFEYVFGLGKLLASEEEYKSLFSGSIKSDVSESIGFNLIAACLGGNVKEIDKIPLLLKNVDLVQFESALSDSIREVRGVLKPFIEIKTNKKLSKHVVYHTEMHIVAIIAKVFRSKYADNLIINKEWNLIKENLLSNIKLHYLYDIIADSWRGSGDTRVNNILKGNIYDQDLTQKDWELKLEEWFQSQLKESSKKRKSISKDQMLFLNYIHTHTHTIYRHMSPIEDHIEHIIPVNKIQKAISLKKMEDAPINAISNFGLLESKVNIKKQDLTIFEYFNKIKNDLQAITDFTSSKDKSFKNYCKVHPELNSIRTQSDLSNFISKKKKEVQKDFLIKESDLSFVSSLTTKDYYTFLEKRFINLKEQFYTLNNIKK